MRVVFASLFVASVNANVVPTSAKEDVAADSMAEAAAELRDWNNLVDAEEKRAAGYEKMSAND